jgi:hypothetical protein
MNKTTATLVAGAFAALSLPALAMADKPESNPHKPASNHASAPSGSNGASTQCHAERSAMGEANFKSAYGTNRNGRNAFGNCVSSKAQEATAEQQQDRVSAAAKCRTEQRSDPAAFKARYGTNRNKSNAFGKCVSSKTVRAGG